MAKVLYEKKGKIAHITLNRPRLNVIDFEMVGELDEIWKDFRDDDNLWVAILSGAGGNFSASFDINDFLKLVDSPGFIWRRSAMFGDKSCAPTSHSIWKPIVGALDGIVNGTAIWLALGCDIRIATDRASFAFGEVRLNVPVEFAALLHRYMPQAIISEMLLTGSSLSAERAYNLGLVNKVVPPEQLMPEATTMANALCEGGPMAVRAMKQLIHQGWDLDYDSALALTAKLNTPVVNSEDTREGFKAFIERRKPVWKGK